MWKLQESSQSRAAAAPQSLGQGFPTAPRQPNAGKKRQQLDRLAQCGARRGGAGRRARCGTCVRVLLFSIGPHSEGQLPLGGSLSHLLSSITAVQLWGLGQRNFIFILGGGKRLLSEITSRLKPQNPQTGYDLTSCARKREPLLGETNYPSCPRPQCRATQVLVCGGPTAQA